jgi:phenylacetate-CoA ligase
VLAFDPWELLCASANYWTWVARVNEISWTRAGGRASIETVRLQRLRGLVSFARERSAFYRDAYRDLPERGADLTQLPVVTKPALMARFDDWLTDSAVTQAGIAAFLGDRTHIGERYLNRYIVWKSSGSTGVPGVYVQDPDALATFDALMAVHLESGGVTAQHLWNFVIRGGRAALVVATGDHFASIASWQRISHDNPAISARGFSILEPLPKLVAALNAYQPVFLGSYPTMLSLLAEEQDAGRLRIAPLHIWSGGECLAPSALEAIERAFACRVVNEYGASECMSIAFGCDEGWLHVNADWVVLEPVDREYRPTPPGEPSHTALLTNLANRVQPIIRYDLGDSVLASPGPCRCGSPLPAIKVEGRHGDVVALRARDGSIVRLLPLALTTIVEEAAHVHRFQIVQSAPDRLLLRLGCCPQGRAAAWHAAATALRAYLKQQSLPDVAVALDKHVPRSDPRSGKLREVVVACQDPRARAKTAKSSALPAA